eukprot:NODE_5562_length_567_cov_72.335907_g4831_i0.p1 GENE.NODE_5562_length_567_cov_72.335907_g4831_i0~~NODE_5562_length_567_cov_72.335907_g4831_i0.p1  ORF type:complete len:157 (+),score=60.57 NODE_5562_length_567_cov_72.335907_g4831_i0:40-471(+)
MVKNERLGMNSIFEEVPIEIHNNVLVSTFLKELSLSESFSKQTAVSDDYSLDVTGYLTKSLEGTIEGVEDLFQSFQKYSWDQRRSKQNADKPDDRKTQKPSRLDSILIGKQITNHCSALEDVALDNFENLYFADTLQKVTEKS